MAQEYLIIGPLEAESLQPSQHGEVEMALDPADLGLQSDSATV